MTIDYANDLDPIPHNGDHLTARQVHRLERYVASILTALDLNYWRVHIGRDLPPDAAALAVYPTPGRRLATITVSRGWYAETNGEEKRIALTHECLHLAAHDAVEVIRRFKNENGDVGEYPMSIVYNQFVLAEERMVDSLSYVLAPHMPAWSTSKHPPADT